MKEASNAPQVVATLKHGKVLQKKYRILFWCYLLFMLVATVAFVTGFIIASCLPKEDVESEEYLVVSVATILVIAVSALLIFVVARDRKHRLEIKAWLADAVKLRAFCEECEKQIFLPLVHNVTCVGNVKVTFHYKGDKKVLCSSLRSNSRNGTGTVFTRFVGKEIYIMYSPKYKQVMFLDEPCEQPQSLEIL